MQERTSPTYSSGGEPGAGQAQVGAEEARASSSCRCRQPAYLGSPPGEGAQDRPLLTLSQDQRELRTQARGQNLAAATGGPF